MEFDNIIKLIKAVSDSALTSLSLEEGNFKIQIEANQTVPSSISPADMQVYYTSTSQPEVKAAEFSEAEDKSLEGKNIVKSPLVGTFYSAGGPGEEPFVKVGDTVKKGQVLGIVEAMKLMNDINCEYDGVVEEILIENEDLVEYDQPLFVIK